jgi:signal transduction histidine kinase
VAAVLDRHTERPAFLFGGRPSEPLASKLRLLRAGVVAAYLVAIALAFQAPGEETYRNEVFHRPFVLALAVAAAVAAWAAWLRYQADGRSGSLWLVIAFATLALLYAPHALLDAGRLDITHLLFGPVSRLGFSLLLLPVVLNLPVPAVRRLPRWGIAAVLVVPALAIDGALHVGFSSVFVQQNAVPVRLTMESAALGAQLLCAGVLAVLFVRRRRRFLLHLALTLTALASGSALFLVAAPWQGRWWVAHLGLFVGAVVLVSGIVDEAARRGSIRGAVDLDPLSEFAEHIVDAMREGIALHDERGRLIAWNPAAVELTGWSAADAAGRDFGQFREGLVGLDGERWVDVVRLELRRYGRPYTATILSDARDRVRASTMAVELELRAHELERSNKALREFAYVVAHDLADPLTSVAGFSELLHRQAYDVLDESSRGYLALIEQQAERMHGMIDGLLAYAQAGNAPLQPARVDCNEVIARVLDGLSAAVRERDVQLSVSRLPTLHADTTWLAQLFQNLLANAVKFSASVDPHVWVAARREGEEWCFTVADNGIGIDPDRAEEIFGVFRRLHEPYEYPGAGIGLAICKEIVERHGGRIGVESRPQGGSRFWFTLPA